MAPGRGAFPGLGHDMTRARKLTVAGIALATIGALSAWFQRDVAHYLLDDPAPFAQRFSAPPPSDPASNRHELAQLLELQASRTAEHVALARADRKTRIQRFYPALGFDADAPPDLPELERLAENVEDDVRIHVRAAKERFRRLRPYEIEPRLEPCIQDVKGDLSYPSGHAAFAHSMALLLVRMVPERRRQVEERAREFANQRMVCGVHFRSDLLAGQQAAEWLLDDMAKVPAFRDDVRAATRELRAALKMPPLEDPFETRAR
jgi:acid phosphatase (class A)